MYVTEHFQREEFSCKCGCGFDSINPELVDLLEKIRVKINKPIKIKSGCRCPDRNRTVKGAKNSQHLTGNAADIQLDGISPVALARFINQNFNPQGLGIYRTFVHIDVRKGKRARWYG